MNETIMIKCSIMRGGTSKAVFLMENHLPHDEELKKRIILSIFGSPDRRQIDGLGGANPLTSKCAVIGVSNRDDADVVYSFYTEGLGSKWSIMNINIKMHACCGFFPPGLDIIQDFVREENLKSDDVEHIKLTSYTLGIDGHTDAQPTSIVGATMSNPYCIAVALATGKCSLNDLSLEKLHDKDFMKMVAKIGAKTEFILDPGMDKQIPGKYPASVQVRVKGGGVLDKHGDLPRGFYPEHPVDDKDLEEKFLGLARMVMNRKPAETVLGLVSELEKLKDIRDLTVFLQP